MNTRSLHLRRRRAGTECDKRQLTVSKDSQSLRNKRSGERQGAEQEEEDGEWRKKQQKKQSLDQRQGSGRAHGGLCSGDCIRSQLNR